MNELFNSDQFRLRPKSTPYLREEIFISTFDAQRIGLNDSGQYCLFSIQPLFPGPKEEEFAVHVAVDSSMEPGALIANQNFLDNAGFRPDDERFWSIKRAPSIVPVQEAVIGMATEQRKIKDEIIDLRRRRRELFFQRCILYDPEQSANDLSLPMKDRGFFHLRSIHPPPEVIRSKSILVFSENTSLKLFVPHTKSGVDMVIVIDASGSMDLPDYVGSDGRPRPRIEGVKSAMETLLQRRLASGSRVSSIAAIVFGENTKMLYPMQDGTMVELKEGQTQVAEMRESVRLLCQLGLDRLQVERTQTNISGALRYAVELLDYFAQEGNEKMLVLLSDGADWFEDAEGKSDGEVVSTAHDPAVLADSLHFDSQVRMHTVAISDEQALRKHADRKYWDQGWAIPNTNLLKKIADCTDGLFIPSPDAKSLVKLFDELGEGAVYPV